MNINAIEKMRSSQPCIGTWLSSGSPVIAELAAQCGFDWLLLDMEHGCLPESELSASLRAIQGHGPAIVVRVPTHEAGVIGRVLDWGADAIMVPHVETAEEAEALVKAMRYAPLGRRGFSRTVPTYGFGLRPPDANADKLPLLMAQIESAKGVAHVEEIAAVPGVDVLFVGPADLRLSLSVEPDAPDFDVALDRTVKAAQDQNIHSGILVRDQRETKTLISRGFTKVAVDSDLSILRNGFLSVAP